MSVDHCYPDCYRDWLFQALALESGDEVEPDFLEPLFAFNHAWVKGEPLPDYADNPAAMRAYACYYMTINMPKLWAVLDRCGPALDAWLAQDELHVTEFGCGPGTFLWAFLFYLRAKRPAAFKRSWRCTGVDRAQGGLDVGQRFWEVLQQQPGFAQHQVEFVNGDWQQVPADSGQLLILGNVLTESADINVATTAADMILVIEPGTSSVFHQRVLPLRDELMTAGWTVEFPCTSQHTCPMAADNWCHFSVNRFVLPFIQRMSNRAKRLNPRHNFCGFCFSRRAGEAVSRWRVLSKLKRVHRSGIRWLCDGEHLVEAVLNRRAKAEGNKAFLNAAAGDTLCITLKQPRPRFLKTGRFIAKDKVEWGTPPGAGAT